MVRKTLWVAVVMVGLVAPVSAERLLIPMDLQQTNHLKAYGLAFWILEHEVTVEWLLNYRGGAFSVDAIDLIDGAEVAQQAPRPLRDHRHRRHSPGQGQGGGAARGVQGDGQGSRGCA